MIGLGGVVGGELRVFAPGVVGFGVAAPLLPQDDFLAARDLALDAGPRHGFSSVGAARRATISAAFRTISTSFG